MGVSRDGPNFFSTPIISGTRKATNFKFGRCIHSVYPTKRLLKIWEKRERGCIQGLSNFFPVDPIISGMRRATNFKFGTYIHRVYPCKSHFKNLGEKGALAYPGTSEIFKYPLLSQERVKLRTSNLASIFRGSMRTNAL